MNLPPHMRPTITEDQSLVLALRVLYTDATNESLGRELGVSTTTVQRYVARWCSKSELREAGARKMAKTRRAPDFNPKPREPRFDWSAVDWSKNNTAIARELGCTPQSAAMARARLGKRASAWRCRPEKVVMKFGQRQSDRTRAEQAIVKRLLETNVTVRRVAEEYGVSEGTIWHLLANHTTPEQRSEMRSRKIAATKKGHVSGFILKTRARMVRRASDPKFAETVKARECAGCGAEFPERLTRCPKCGCGVAQAAATRMVEAKPERKRLSGRERVAAFLRELEAVA